MEESFVADKTLPPHGGQGKQMRLDNTVCAGRQTIKHWIFLSFAPAVFDSLAPVTVSGPASHALPQSLYFKQPVARKVIPTAGPPG
jgi:hypothetical protein